MNDIYVKVREGTRSDSMDLCRSCTKSVIIKGGAEGNEQRFCQAVSYDTPLRLHTFISNCSDYYNKNLPSRADLEKSAWILTTSKGRKIGFVPYADWRAANQDEELIPD